MVCDCTILGEKALLGDVPAGVGRGGIDWLVASLALGGKTGLLPGMRQRNGTGLEPVSSPYLPPKEFICLKPV